MCSGCEIIPQWILIVCDIKCVSVVLFVLKDLLLLFLSSNTIRVVVSSCLRIGVQLEISVQKLIVNLAVLNVFFSNDVFPSVNGKSNLFTLLYLQVINMLFCLF